MRDPNSYRGARRTSAKAQKLIWRELPRSLIGADTWSSIRKARTKDDDAMVYVDVP